MPRTYYRPIQISGIAITILFIVGTFSTFFTSPAMVTLWFVLILVVVYISLAICVFVWYRMAPPSLERAYVNDKITVLHLDD